MPDPFIKKPLHFLIPDTLQTIHTSHLMVQQMPGRYLFSFFEVLPPMIVGVTDQEKQQEWAAISSIPATCVARLVVAEADLAGFIQVMQQQLALTKQQMSGNFKAFA